MPGKKKNSPAAEEVVEGTPAEEPEEQKASGPDLGDTPEGMDLLDSIFNDGFSEDVSSAMDFDPFDKKKEPVVTEGEATAGEPADDEKPPSEIIGAPGDKPPEEVEKDKKKGKKAVPKADPEEAPKDEGAPAAPAADPMAELQAQLALVKQSNIDLQAQVTAANAIKGPAATEPVADQKKGPAAEEPKPDLPSYMVQMPQELMTMLNSEDSAERATGFSHLANGIGQMVHGTVLQAVRTELGSAMKDLEVKVGETQVRGAEQQAASTDFYAAFPALDDPSLKPLVAQVATAIVSETGASKWTKELRDAIGLRATNIIKAAAAGKNGDGGGEATPPSGQSSQLPPTQIKSGARPQAPSQESGEGFIANTLFGG